MVKSVGTRPGAAVSHRGGVSSVWACGAARGAGGFPELPKGTGIGSAVASVATVMKVNEGSPVRGGGGIGFLALLPWESSFA